MVVLVLLKDMVDAKESKDSSSNSNTKETIDVNNETILMNKPLVVEIFNASKDKEVAATRKEVTLKEMNPLYAKLMENPLVFDDASSSDKHSKQKYSKESEKSTRIEVKRHKIYFDLDIFFIYIFICIKKWCIIS